MAGMIKYRLGDESITLDYPVEREDEVLALAARTFCDPWTAHIEIRWRKVLADDAKRREK